MKELMVEGFLYNPNGDAFHCEAPSVLALPNGQMLAVWYAYPEKKSKLASLVSARREAGSEQWETSVRFPQRFDESAANPVLFAEPGGTVWLLFVLVKGYYRTGAELYACCSHDGGAHWSEPQRACPGRGLMLRHPPVRLDDGSMLLPVYDEMTYEPVFLTGRSPFFHWKELYRFRGCPLIQPVIVRDHPGRFTALFDPVDDSRQIRRSHSDDGGRTWCDPVQTSMPNSSAGIAAFAVDDRLAAVYNQTYGSPPLPLNLIVSRDGGLNWSRPRCLDSVRGELSFPSFVVGPDAHIHGVYSYNRRQIRYISFPFEMLREEI